MIVGNEGGYKIGFLQGAHSKSVINFHAVHPKTSLRVLNLRSHLTNPPPPPPKKKKKRKRSQLILLAAKSIMRSQGGNTTPNRLGHRPAH